MGESLSKAAAVPPKAASRGGVLSTANKDASTAGNNDESEEGSSELPFFLGLGLVCALGVVLAEFALASSPTHTVATAGSVARPRASGTEHGRGSVYGLLFSFLGGAHSLHKGAAGRGMFLWLTVVVMVSCITLEVAIVAGWLSV
jgi:hypothetical protein